MSTRRKQYRVYSNGVLLSEPGISARDMKSLVALIRVNGRKARVDEYSGRHDIWITVQDDGGYMDVLTAHMKNRNRSGGRVTYTVATIDPYTQRRTSRLGRQISKREAMKIADLWERNGAKDVCVIDSRGIIHRQPSNHPVNRNRSGQRKERKHVQFAGYDINKEYSEVQRSYIDTSKHGDTGADPIGDGTFRMYPSGDIVSWDERNRRLGSLSLNKNKGFRL